MLFHLKYFSVPAPALFDERMTPALFRTLNYICYLGATKPDKKSWHSYANLSDLMKINKRVIMRQIDLLCEYGYLIREKRARGNGSQTSNYFIVNFEVGIVEHSDPEGHDIGDPEGHGGMYREGHPQKNNKNLKDNKKNIYKKDSVFKAAKNLITLAQWEENTGGKLCINQMRKWVRENNLNKGKTELAIEEFRDRMNATEKRYANFVSAFKLYLRNNWLNIKFKETFENDLSSGGVVLQEKGLSL